MKKITIEDILKPKKVTKSIEMFYDSETLGGRIDFERIDTNKIMEILDEVKKNLMTVHNANLYVIYLSVPMFRNQELLDKYEIKDSPYKIVEELLNHNVLEITQFADKILALYGFAEEQIKKIKK